MRPILLISIFVFIISSCEKEKISIDRPFPRVKTMDAFNINGSGASFKAQILKLTE